jgi:hypothetical protein
VTSRVVSGFSRLEKVRFVRRVRYASAAGERGSVRVINESLDMSIFTTKAPGHEAT